MNAFSCRITASVACLVLISGCSQSTETSQSGEMNADSVQRVSEKGPVRLTVTITPAEPRLSDLVEMDVEVTAPPQVEIKPPAFGEAVGDFLVRDYSERSPKNPIAKDPADEQTRLFHYQLEPVHSGTHLVRSIAIEFTDNREDSEARGKATFIKSDPIEIKVTSELSGQIPDLGNLEPMLPPQPLDSSKNFWWTGLLIVAVAVLLLVLRARRMRASKVASIPVQTPEEIAQITMAQLLSENLPSQGLFKEFYVRLTGIVRVYIEGKTGLRAPEQTTEEFLQEMRLIDIFPVERSASLAEFLEAADMVKYAGQQPGSDQIELSILLAKEFITS